MSEPSFKQMQEFFRQVEAGRATSANFQEYLKNPDRFVETIGGDACGDVYSLVVDYSKSLSEMIAAGKYDWVNDDITAKHFPVMGNGQAEIVPQLVHFNRSISSDTAIAELNSRGLRPATLPELLAFGAKYPELQRQFPIVALGSVWVRLSGSRCVACLHGVGVERDLGPSWCGDGWHDGCRFLAVPK